MSREIRRKIIDNDMTPPEEPDDFEKQLESQLAADFDVASDRSDMSLMMPDEEGESHGPDLFDFSETSDSQEENSSHGFSLDAFDPVMEEQPEPESPPEPAPVAVPSSAHVRKVALKKMLLLGVSSLLLVAVVCAFAVRMLVQDSTPAPRQIVSQIRKQIVVPHFQEKAEFFIVANAQDGKKIVFLSLELDFHSEEKYRSYQNDSTLFRDTVYRFLEAQHPPRNTLKDWQKIVQRDLTAHLHSALPGFRADQMRVSRIERL
ncbi:MAG: hypothetical protein ABFD98_16700 [Syntrophobacteraceae bacterium]|nr:hypothetical protein [Desulfobacteraceae bacterium]